MECKVLSHRHLLPAMALGLMALTAPLSAASLWTAATIPSTVDSGDAGAVTVGVKFQANTTGNITGIRFYKASTNTGTHIGALYSSSGTLLASATFTGETASGWQQVNFASPVAIAANTTYTAAYHTNVGHYSDNSSYFATSAYTSGNLTALKDAAGSSNGCYTYGASTAYPSSSFNSTNYWVDVAFTAVALPPPVPVLPTASPGISRNAITWLPSAGATSYKIYRSTTAGGEGTTPLASGITTRYYFDNGLISGTKYYYKVAAVSSAGTSAQSVETSATARSLVLSVSSSPSTGGYPDATNTGVPTGTTLTASSDIDVETDGTVVDAKDVTGNINVNASNVTIKRCRVTTSGINTFCIIIRPGAKNVNIQDCTIRGVNNTTGEAQYGVDDQSDLGQNVHIYRCNMYYISEGVNGVSPLIQDCYLHDFGYVTGDHTDGFITGGGGGATVEHNTILISQNQTGTICLFPEGSAQANDTIDNNLLAGGGYTVYGGSGTPSSGIYSPGTNIKITNNRFSKLYFTTGGFNGTDTAYDNTGSGNAWTGNFWDNDGTNVPF